MSLVGGGRGLLGNGLAPAGGPPGTNLHKMKSKQTIGLTKQYYCCSVKISEKCIFPLFQQQQTIFAKT